ncbi:nucleoid-associated protein [Paenibacillus macerans]|uniref:nucleoid-associated protein n=1 Tax=Paenibacillus macerans TaxID=44252 RepID=UPI0022E43589|nr:nucleoid-associated protein [Paenibacillus macerans]
MSKIIIEKLIAHDLDLSRDNPITYNQIMNLSSIPVTVLDFFSTHIANAIITKQIKNCRFTHTNASVLINCIEISQALLDDNVFITNTIDMTQHLFSTMKATATRSSGTLIFIIYFDSDIDKNYLAIMKMDPNKAIQIDRKKYTFIVQENILPGVNEKLHKCAFIKLDSNLWSEDVHLRVLDKQQVTGEVSKYFLRSFLESQVCMNDKTMTELINSNLVQFALQESIVEKAEVVNFNAKVDRLLCSGNEIDLDRDLDSLFKTYVPGEADRLEKIEGFKKNLLAKNEHSYFEFTAEKKPTIAMIANQDNTIKIQFPLQYKDTKIFLEYLEEDGIETTVIRIKGIHLHEKFK